METMTNNTQTESIAYQTASDLFTQLKGIEEHYENLLKSLSIQDKKICDIEHFIEITDGLNAAKGFNMYKMLREELKTRREIKDQIYEMKPIMDKLKLRDIIEQENQILSSIRDRGEQMERRTYKTRVMKDVFGSKIE
mgnify:CR=1 FL=1